jgi:RNA polymerase subunit RPABC4/transcription elongation factor Spt4
MIERLCQECHTPYKPGALFCDECGNRLFTSEYETWVDVPTVIAKTKALVVPSTETQVLPGEIEFVILSSERHLTLPLDDEIYIGRSDPVQGITPQVDLSEDDGARLGVSRSHAFLQSTANGVMLVDLGSTNGTHLHEESLVPHEPSQIRSGDTFRLGHLQIQIFFEV